MYKHLQGSCGVVLAKRQRVILLEFVIAKPAAANFGFFAPVCEVCRGAAWRSHKRRVDNRDFLLVNLDL